MIAALSPRFAAALARRTRRTLATLSACAMTVAWSASARAEGPSDYCQRVTARAESDAALLIAPTAHVQLIRFPNNGPADPAGLQIGSGIQPRAALSVGFVDIYKGFGVIEVARADCRRQASASTLEEVVALRADIGRRPALQTKLAFLRANAGVVKELVRNAEERFAAHTTTLTEVQDIRIRALSFARRTAETEHEIALLDERHLTLPAEPLSEVLRAYEARTLEVEDRLAHVRNLEPWKFGVVGGVAATPAADVYGVAELSYNFGGLFRAAAERHAVAARAGELKNARHEMRHQLDTMMRELRASAEHSRQQARALEVELIRMMRERASLEGVEAPNKLAVLAMMTLQMIDLEAEQRFLTTLAAAQSGVGGAK